MNLTRTERERRRKRWTEIRSERRRERKKRKKAEKEAIGTYLWLQHQPKGWRGRLWYHHRRQPGGDVDGAFLDTLMRAQEGRCHYCEMMLLEDDLVLEHIIPKCKGGGFTKENIALACWDCNTRKGTLDVEQFVGRGFR